MAYRDVILTGRLVVNNQYPSYVLPIVSQVITDADTQVQGDFVSGDDRTNETPGLSLMHNCKKACSCMDYKLSYWMTYVSIMVHLQCSTGSTID